MRTVISTVSGIDFSIKGRRFFFYLFTLLSLFYIFPNNSHAYQAILEIVLNSEAKGSFFVETADNGNFLIKAVDLVVLGLPDPGTATMTIDGEEYYSLDDHQGLDYQLNEQTLSLEITVKPDILPLSRIDLTNQRPGNIYIPRETSAFLNYGLSASGNKDETLSVFDFTHELVFRKGKTLYLTDGIYSQTKNDSAYTRLITQAIHDNPNSLRRVTAGDHTVLSGPLGSQILLGGAGYSKNFNIDPYYINYPSVHMGGTSATPSQVEIYIDGILMRKEDIPPGPFIVENITRYEGAGDVEIVLRDAFNREQRISHPFYLAENLLVPGEHEFSYNAGALREDFGIESNEYGDVSFSGFHRYGYRDWLTVGLSSEINSDFFSLAPRVSVKWKHYGSFDFAFGTSSGNSDHNGFASALEYFYRNRRFSVGLKVRNFSENYSRLDALFRTDKPNRESQIRFGYSTPAFGSLNIGFTSNTFHIGEDRDEIAVTYNKRLARNLSMYATVNQSSATEDETILLIGFNYSPWRHNQINARIEDRERSRTASVGIQKNPPVGEGYGYRAAMNLTETDVSNSYSLSAGAQYNSRFSILRADTDLISVDSEFLPTYRASVGGAISFIAGSTHFSRPIRDSFTLIKVGELADIRVVRNSSVIGRTNNDGLIMVPELTSYFDNQIAIKDEDLPIEYGIDTSLQYIQPPLRSGSCIIFSAAKIQPIIGKFTFNSGGKKVPYDFRPITVEVNELTIETQTGYDGEFYIDLAEAGEGHAVQLGCDKLQPSSLETQEKMITITYNFNGITDRFELAIPSSEELFIDMGELLLNEKQELGNGGIK